MQSISSLVDTVYVIDDGSTDSTASRASEAGAEVIAHTENRGVGVALQTGYDIAVAHDAALLIQLDADGQHDPAFVSNLLDELDEETDIVIGSRFLDGAWNGYSLIRRSGVRFFSFLTSVLGGHRIFDVTSGYRIYRVSALSRLPPGKSRHWAVRQTLTAMRLGLNVKEVGIPIPPRRSGQSQFQPQIALLYPLRIFAGILGAIIETSRLKKSS